MLLRRLHQRWAFLLILLLTLLLLAAACWVYEKRIERIDQQLHRLNAG